MKKLFLFFGIIAFDQLFKYLAIHDLLPSLGGLFIDPVCNPFIAWSIPLQDALFFTVWILAVTFLVILAKKMDWNVFLVMILGGAGSNFIDRIRFDCVIDFIQVGNFPTFNFADAFITVGVVLFLIQFLREPKKNLSS